VITKIDRVDAGRVNEVEAAVRALLASTLLADVPVVAVSAVTGAGIAALRQRLADEAQRYSGKHTEGQHFRYAIDRAFTIAGSGTVVTGTVFNGSVKTGDRLMISPAGLAVRVRGIQIQGRAAEEARAGERCALNLTGADLESVRRGDWVLAPEIHHPTNRIDARVKVLESETRCNSRSGRDSDGAARARRTDRRAARRSLHHSRSVGEPHARRWSRPRSVRSRDPPQRTRARGGAGSLRK
jgi:selenocysteine-specific elongation factor